jgi:hypothetical protein
MVCGSRVSEEANAALEVMRSYGNRMNEPLSQWSNQRDRLQLPALPRCQGVESRRPASLGRDSLALMPAQAKACNAPTIIGSFAGEASWRALALPASE